ncbi:hypothetical protein L7F22_066673 [Adiantum nelumboides]|nr:hypothetical protein [Adiantum nelumboides]
MSDLSSSRAEIQCIEREERRQCRDQETADRLAARLERINDFILGCNSETEPSISRNTSERARIQDQARTLNDDPYLHQDSGESSSAESVDQGANPLHQEEGASASLGPQSSKHRQFHNRRSELKPRSLNFWDDPDFDNPFALMAIPGARATIRLADFTSFAGLWDEDPHAHVQKFEVTCVANEIVDDDQKLHILLATFKDEAASWYGNLGARERATYVALTAAFLLKFRRQGFQDRLAQQLDYFQQGINESIDHYIQRMETIVRKMGASAPNDDTKKRRLIDCLRDPNAQQYVSLRRPVDLAAAKQEARNWEEVQLSQQRRRELFNGPVMVTPNARIPRAQEASSVYGNVPPQVVVNTNQAPYLPPNPYMTAPAYMLQTSTPTTPPLTEERVVQLMAIAVGKLKEEILSAVKPQVKEVYAINQQPMGPSTSAPPVRSNIWCDEENKIEDEGDMSQATQQVLPTIDEEIPFHKGDAMSTQEVVEHESDFVAQKPSNDMNKGSENMLPTIGEIQIHEGNTRNSEEKMVVVENQSDVQTYPKPSDDMIIKDTYSMPLRDEEVEGSEKKDEANEEHQGALATTEVQDKVDKGTGEATRNANKAQSI